MFNFLTDSIENALQVGGAILNGEDITTRQVARLVADGVSIAAIAAATGLAVDVIERMLKEYSE